MQIRKANFLKARRRVECMRLAAWRTTNPLLERRLLDTSNAVASVLNDILNDTAVVYNDDGVAVDGEGKPLFS